MKLIYLLCALASAVIFAPSIDAQKSQSSRTSFSIQTPSRKYSYAIVSRDGNISSWGSFDSSFFNELKRKNEDAIFVRKDGNLYVITDSSLVSQARSATQPMEELGHQQGALGREQGKLGAEQGKLGAKQGEYGRQLGELGRSLASEERGGKSGGDVTEKMKQVGEQMKALGRQQSALGEKQKALGARQSELGHKQGEAAREADAKITKLIDDAFARGLAKKV